MGTSRERRGRSILEGGVRYTRALGAATVKDSLILHIVVVATAAKASVVVMDMTCVDQILRRSRCIK